MFRAVVLNLQCAGDSRYAASMSGVESSRPRSDENKVSWKPVKMSPQAAWKVRPKSAASSVSKAKALNSSPFTCVFSSINDGASLSHVLTAAT